MEKGRVSFHGRGKIETIYRSKGKYFIIVPGFIYKGQVEDFHEVVLEDVNKKGFYKLK